MFTLWVPSILDARSTRHPDRPCAPVNPGRKSPGSNPRSRTLERLPVAVLISGRGTNLQSLIDDCAREDFPARIVMVFSNVPGAEGLERAAGAGLPTVVLDHKSFEDRDAFDEAIAEKIDESGAQLVCLAGFMRRLGAKFVEHYHDRILNIHPSLLPAFPGLHVHQRVIDSGARFSGCTVHIVRPEVDSGPIVVQAAVPVHPDDTADTLAARVLEQEHGAYPRAVRWFAEGRLTVEGEKVLVDGTGPPGAVLVNPGPSD